MRLILAVALVILIMPVSARAGNGSGPPPSNAELQQKCDGGDATECGVLGLRFLKGEGVAKDAKKAATLFQRSCDGGNAVGCYDVADSFRFGEGVGKDLKAASALYQRSCDGGYAEGCAQLAYSYGAGEGLKKDENKAAFYADRACKEESPLGCTLLGLVYKDGVTGYSKDEKRAKDLLFRSCDRGDFAPACRALASITKEPVCRNVYNDTMAFRRSCADQDGKWPPLAANENLTAPNPPKDPAPRPQVSTASLANAAVTAGNAAYARKDYATAAAQFASACDNGSASACGVLGEMFVSGQGVSASGAKAAGPLAKACDGGMTAACGKLGILFDTGNGVSVNKKRAFDLFNGACSRSDNGSCYQLGRLYEAGQGTGVNVAQAASLYQKACTAGIADGCSSVGTMYVNGVHFAKSESQAEAFYKLACNKGGARGCGQIASLAAERKRRSDLAAAIAAEKLESSKISSGRTNASVQGRPSCLVDTSYSTGGEEYWDDNIVWGEWRKSPTRTHFEVKNNCSQTIVQVNVEFFRESRSRGDNYSYTQEIRPGFSYQKRSGVEYYLADQWKKIKPIFESREMKNIDRR